MQRIENGLLYDTETATLIGSAHGLLQRHDFYRTKNGRYFCVYSSIVTSIYDHDLIFTSDEYVKKLMYEYIPEVASLIYQNIKEA